MLWRVEGYDRACLRKPIALEEIEPELLILLEYLRTERSCTADEQFRVVKSDLGKDLLVEEASQRCFAEAFLAESIECHQSFDQGVCEGALFLHFCKDSCNDLVVQERNTHEYGYLAHPEVVYHPGYDYAMSEETFGAVADRLKKNRSAAI